MCTHMYVCTHIPLDSVFVYIMHIYSCILAHIHAYIHTYIKSLRRTEQTSNHTGSCPILPVVIEIFGGMLIQVAMAAAHQGSKKL